MMRPLGGMIEPPPRGGHAQIDHTARYGAGLDRPIGIAFNGACKQRSMQNWTVKARHRAIRGAEIVGGKLFLSRPIQGLWRSFPRLRPKWVRVCSDRPEVGAIAVVAHAYYPDILPEVLTCWRNVVTVGSTASLHITTTGEQLQ